MGNEKKICTRCKNEYPASLEFFHKNKNGLYGLHSICKICRLKEKKEKEKLKANNKILSY